jgi:hypothetical protein
MGLPPWWHHPSVVGIWQYWEHELASDDLLRERVEEINWLWDVVDRADRVWEAYKKGAIPALERGTRWGRYLGIMLDAFSAPGQVIDNEPLGTEFSDTCLVCGGDTRPDTTVTQRTLTRGYYKCRVQHTWGELPAWWTDWKSSEVVDRQVIFTPNLAGGGNTWSTAPLGKKWGYEVSDLFRKLRPTRPARPSQRPHE